MKVRPVDMPFVMKILMPEALAAAVIGKGGAVIKSIRESTGAKLGITEHNEMYPGTDARICTVQAGSPESVHDVVLQVITKLQECVAVSPSDSLGNPGELKLRALMPRAAVGGLIGRGGASIKQLREQTGSKVSISEADGGGPAAEQVVAITGTKEAVEYVMAEANKQVQELHTEPWFNQWASSTAVGGGRDDGRNAPAYHAESGRATSSGGGKGFGQRGMPPSNGDSSVEMLISCIKTLPEYVMHDARGFALSCIVPNNLVGGLIGRGGTGTKEVQRITSTQIGIREITGDPDNRTLNISGPLANTCAAYMMMMKRFLDAEAQSLGGPPGNGKGSGRW